MNKYIHIDSFVEKDGYIYISDKDINALYRCSVDNWTVEFIGSFPGENAVCDSMHGHTFYMEGKILFCPMNTGIIHVYDIDNASFSKYRILDFEKNSYAYIGITVMNNKAYLFPYNAPSMVIMDLQFLDDCDNNSFVERHKIIKREDINIKVSHAYFCLNDYIFLAPANGVEKILRIDTRSDEIEKFAVNKGSIQFDFIFAIDEDVILLASMSDNKVYKYSITEEKLVELFEGKKGNVIGFADCEEGVVSLFSDIRSSVLINKDTMGIEALRIDCDDDPGMYYRYLGKLADGRLMVAAKYDRECTMEAVDLKERRCQKIALNRNRIKRGLSTCSFDLNEPINEMFADDLINLLRVI